ncbi:MAG: hypothetical protein ACI6PR_04795 [Pseudoalteromonas sp.]|uniref:hypothetical protein n=1 Tax=Pseudoalteromonas sp. TaxID=53249 RepID=UPI0038514B70
MNNLHVDDISSRDLISTRYDISVFSCGYEERCIEIPSRVEPNLVEDTIVISFNQHREDEVRVSCYDFYKEVWPKSNFVESSQDGVKEIYNCLHQIVEKKNKDELRILIDYTSMSRVWYSAILNYLIKFSEKNFIIDLAYASGVYHDVNLNVELGDIKIIPGCEGISLTKKSNAAIFMLGFDNYGPLRLYNLLNPNKCFGVMASPASTYQYEETCYSKNNNFIKYHLGGKENLIRLPINSISACYENMSQLLQPLEREYNVSIIPFGPKPHILTAILCSFNFPNVTCMYSEYLRKSTTRVQATGDLVLSRVFSKGLRHM